MIINASNIETVGRFDIITSDEDFYSYLALALIGLSLLKRERKIGTKKTPNRGLYYEFLETLRRIARSRLRCKFDSLRAYTKRLPLGTIYWGKMSSIPVALTSSPHWHESLGGMIDLLKIWPSKIPKKTNH